MARLKGIERQNYQKFLVEKYKRDWLTTASPFLVAKFTPKPPQEKHHQGRKKQKRKSRKYWQEKQLTYREFYNRYILSKEWRARKENFYKKFGRKCVACGTKKKLNVHHMSYENLTHEKDEELIVLCVFCHEEYHNQFGVQRNMVKKTLQFIENKRERA